MRYLQHDALLHSMLLFSLPFAYYHWLSIALDYSSGVKWDNNLMFFAANTADFIGLNLLLSELGDV